MLEEVIATHFAWPCRYTPTICDGPVIRWGDGDSADRYRFEVSASRNGVMIHGSSGVFQVNGDTLDQFVSLLKLAKETSGRIDALGMYGKMDGVINWLRSKADPPKPETPRSRPTEATDGPK